MSAAIYWSGFAAREWDYVAENMLLGVRLGLLVPNDYQINLIKIYIWEHAASCCRHCGLTPGMWCGEFLCVYRLNSGANIPCPR